MSLNFPASNKRYFFIFMCLLVMSVWFLYIDEDRILGKIYEKFQPIKHKESLSNDPTDPSKFLVYTEKCKIPKFDPYARDIMKYFKRQKYQPCSDVEPLTKMKYNSEKKIYILHFNEDLLYHNTINRIQLKCCYQIITRSGEGAVADNIYNLSECIEFTKSIQVPLKVENILVQCKDENNYEIYRNAYAMIQQRPEIKFRLDEWQKNDTNMKPISVLLIAIDSISRQDFIRAMPKTAEYLHNSEWFEMTGYNKIGDKSFPNLMSILTGYNETNAKDKCNPQKIGGVDKCPIIWNEFQKYGYVTVYAEDETFLSTFNYAKYGFEKPPTDYYLRPFLLAAEAYLPNKINSTLKFCLGYQHSADYVFQYALEFATNYKNNPFFGLFRINSFSHENINDSSSMDEKIIEYIQEFSRKKILNETIVIFFSDHGKRYGPTRKLFSTYYEERLPFFFVWLPSWMRSNHPEFVNALRINKNRLINPFDVHMTLKHILELSGRVKKNFSKAEDCANCQSLLDPVPETRSCEDIAIGYHWCTCYNYQAISTKSFRINEIANYIVNYINHMLLNFDNGQIAKLCSQLTLKRIHKAYMAMKGTTRSGIDIFRIIFHCNPGNGIFEATISHNTESNSFEIVDSISRLNHYRNISSCVSNEFIKKYCVCKDFFISN